MLRTPHKRLKILIVTDTYYPQKNGVVVFLDQILNRLKKDHNVVVIAPGIKQKIENQNNLKTYWVSSIQFPFYEGYRISTASSKTLEKIIKSENPDVVHTHAPIVLGLVVMGITKSLGIPTVATYHTHFEDYFPHLMKGNFKNALRLIGSVTTKKLIKHFYSRANIITAPSSEYVKLLKKYGLKKVELLENGIELARFKKNKNDIRKKYNLPSDKKIVLYLGRISFEKNLELLFNAFKEVDATLVIAGSGPYLNRYQKMAKDMRNVFFTGFVDDYDLSQIYKTADLFVSASDSEVMPLTFIEAMVSGLPIICPKSRGTSDLVTHKVNGLLFTPNKASSLVRQLKRLLNDEVMLKKMSKKSKKMAENFSIAKCYKRTIELYKRLLNG